MASRKIEELDIEDLSLIERLLSKEFNRQSEHERSFRTKNNWFPGDDQLRLTRLRDAVRSQRKFKQLTQDKW